MSRQEPAHEKQRMVWPITLGQVKELLERKSLEVQTQESHEYSTPVILRGPDPENPSGPQLEFDTEVYRVDELKRDVAYNIVLRWYGDLPPGS